MPFDPLPQQDAIASFLERFRAAAKMFTWSTEVNECEVHFRGTRGMLFFKNEFCPLTATLYAETGRFVTTDNWEIAAAHLGLSRDDARRIVDAADLCEECDKTLRFSMMAQT